MISIPPVRFGGNHKHPRREIFISLSDDVELHWVDEDGILHINKMQDENQLYLFDVHPLCHMPLLIYSTNRPLCFWS